MFAVRIRGIYTTALTNLFSKRGLRITQPSRVIRERFKLEGRLEPPDVDVRDLEDHQGVLASGQKEALEKIKGILQEQLLDVIARCFSVGLYAIYLGRVEALHPSQGAFVNLGTQMAFLPASKADRLLTIGENVLVQVIDFPTGPRKPVLSMSLSMPGKYAVLVPQNVIKFSKRLQDPKQRQRLQELAESVLKDRGVIWRTAAQLKSNEELTTELHQLCALAEEVARKSKGCEAPSLLLEGDRVIQFEFPGDSKRSLDELRNEIIPTLEGHHKRKAAGAMLTTDFAEAAITRGMNVHISAEALIPPIRKIIGIEHVKPDGEIKILGKGKVISSDAEKRLIRIRREMRPGGRYDGLAVEKEPGDYAITDLQEGAWSYKTSYYSQDGRLKGEYVNINTPIELYPDKVRYIDLEIDIVKEPSGHQGRSLTKTIDEGALQRAVEAGFISETLAQRARVIAQELSST